VPETEFPDEPPPPGFPTCVYVVATGGVRVAVESETPIGPEEATHRALRRLMDMRIPSLGVLTEVTDCSDPPKSCVPLYTEKESVLQKLGYQPMEKPDDP
jgi:hypothetical protein